MQYDDLLLIWQHKLKHNTIGYTKGVTFCPILKMFTTTIYRIGVNLSKYDHYEAPTLPSFSVYNPYCDLSLFPLFHVFSFSATQWSPEIQPKQDYSSTVNFPVMSWAKTKPQPTLLLMHIKPLRSRDCRPKTQNPINFLSHCNLREGSTYWRNNPRGIIITSKIYCRSRFRDTSWRLWRL